MYKIGVEYRKYYLLGYKLDIIEENDGTSKNKEYYLRLKKKVDYILRQLDPSYVDILEKDYFKAHEDNWWIYSYTKSTYYRLKNKAIDTFLMWWNE
jgi:hypothetical protein